MRVAIVAEFYPRAADPVFGVWAHRQAVAARDAGADVRVLVLHRPLPSRAALGGRRLEAALTPLRQPLRAELDGIKVRYVPFLAPPRERSYGSWGAWAAPSLALALRALRRSFRFELVHAHYAAPAGDAVRRSRLGVPLVVSSHGGDVYAVARHSEKGRRAVEAAFAAARLVVANSEAIEKRCAALGAARTRVIHLGADLPEPHSTANGADGTSADGVGAAPRIVTVGNLIPRKRHADVLRALWLLRDAEPHLRWIVVGDGPERTSLERLASELGVAHRVEFRGAMPHDAAVAAARSATAFVLPSLDEAFGVAYVEAMAGAVPAIGCRGEPGPEELARFGGGIRLVPAADPEALAAELHALLADEELRQRIGERARMTVSEHFTWERCGRDTVAAYEEALAG
jgi:glycosyltransferase involved in cell wall biosynthesis